MGLDCIVWYRVSEMSIMGRILVLILLNLAGLTFLIIKLIKAGNGYSQALRISWNWIIADQSFANNWTTSPRVAWVGLLRKTWWVTLLIYFLFWIIAPESELSIILLMLIAIHLYWYFAARLSGSEPCNRIFYLNLSWGIVYQEIGPDTDWKDKSLAELDLRKKNLLVLAVERNGELVPFPKGLEVLNCGDRLLVFGELERFKGINRL